MGFWARIFGRENAAPNGRFAIAGEGEYGFELVGESRYQENLELACGGRTDEGATHECVACLIPEPTNRYDPNAVRVEISGRPVGYLSREDAIRYASELRRIGMSGRTATCGAMIVGGWDRGKRDRGHFGVKLDMGWPLRRE